ncbi:hypothetical protein C6B37_01640, partial [Candidatus Phytoplasma phoenicium]
MNEIKNQLTTQDTLIETKNHEIKKAQAKIKTLEDQLKMKEENLETLQKEIHNKEELLKTKEKELEETKNMSAQTKNNLTSEIETLKEDINQKQIHFDIQLLLKDEHIQTLEEHNLHLQQELTTKQEETKSLRTQHEKTLAEIQKQIEHYQTQVTELEQEAEALKQKIAANNDKAEQLKADLTNKQTQINEVNLELGKLQTQKASIEQEISTLNQTYDEWLNKCEIKANQKTYSNYHGYKRDTDEPICKDTAVYYSPVPFQVEATINLEIPSETMQEYRRNQKWTDENKTTFTSMKTQLNGQDVYYIRFYFYKNKIEKINIKNNASLHNKTSLNSVNIRSVLMNFDHPVSETPPPQILNENSLQFLENKKKELKTLSTQLETVKEALNQTQEEMNALIQQTTPDNSLELEVQNKEKHIKDLKKEMDELTLKEQGFQTQIKSLEIENQNLKTKYDHDLKQVIHELEETKKENAQLE